MADAAKEVAPDGCAEHLRIDMNDPASADRWAKELAVAPETLVQAVKAVGPCADDVADYLTRQSVSGNQPTS
jgi:hypothetical protein